MSGEVPEPDMNVNMATVAVDRVPESGRAWRLARELNTNNNSDPGEREHEGWRGRAGNGDAVGAHDWRRILAGSQEMRTGVVLQ